jgi:hypothetical protein
MILDGYMAVRCFDNDGLTADRYTVVFLFNEESETEYDCVSMSESPTHPQGVCMHGKCAFSMFGTNNHLGRVIPFSSLPEACQSVVKNDLK